MEPDADCQGCPVPCATSVPALVHTLAEFERCPYRPPGVIFLGRGGPENDQEALAYHGLERPVVLLHDLLGQAVELLHQAVQGIKVRMCTVCHSLDHTAAKHRHWLALFTERP